MTFAKGDAVEVKAAPGLGPWVQGEVTAVREGVGRQRNFYEVAVAPNYAISTFCETKVRRPRRAKAPTTIGTRPKRAKSKRVDNTGRGPLRYPNYLKWVKTKPCIFCGRKADDPHHVGSKGLSQQTDDTKLVAVCRKAHDALHHRRPDELCAPLAYLREETEHAWAVVEAHLGRYQAVHITEYLRFHGGVMS